METAAAPTPACASAALSATSWARAVRICFPCLTFNENDNENLQSANPVKSCTKRCTVIRYILTENEEEKIHIQLILTSNYISPSI